MLKLFTSIIWKSFSIICLTLLTLQLSAQQRQNISSYSAAERLELRNLMMGYITTPIVQTHSIPSGPSFHCYDEYFLSWHRTYIADMEAYLLTQPNGGKYVPLPKWNPNTSIPNEFFNDVATPGVSAVAPGFAWGSLLSNQNPNPANFDFSTFFNNATLCSFTAGTDDPHGPTQSKPARIGTAIDNFALNLEEQHDFVHGAIGGIMNSFESPAAAIFWLWHAWVDDIYRAYECDCQGVEANDIYIKDSNDDVGNEPNNETTGGFYKSQDIWVRQNQDTQVGGVYTQENNPTRHEQPEYRNPATEAPNYVYVKIRNRGCSTFPTGQANLRVYWSKASTGLGWSANFVNDVSGGIMYGDEMTTVPVAIPAIAPGETYVAEVPWYPPNPADFGDTGGSHICLLARIVSTSDPMTFVETNNIGNNTRNNNNIAWKNVHVFDNVDPFSLVAADFMRETTFIVRQTFNTPVPIRLVFNAPANIPFEPCTFIMEPKLFNIWKETGPNGLDGIRLTETQDGQIAFRILRSGGSIGNLILPPGEPFSGKLTFNFQCRGEQGLCANYGDVFRFEVQQFVQGAFTDELVGGNVYEARIAKNKKSDCGEESLIKEVKVKNASCANYQNGAIRLGLVGEPPFSIFWSNGVNDQEGIGDLTPGTYHVVVRDARNCIDSKTIEVKDDSDLKLTLYATPAVMGCREVGSIELGVEGGAPPYSVQWSVGHQGDDYFLENLKSGMYYVTVFDNADCARTDSIYVERKFPFKNKFEVRNASTSSSMDGYARAIPAGGLAPYQFKWNNGATTESIDGVKAGTYTVVITDSKGCSYKDQVMIGADRILGIDLELSIDAENESIGIFELGTFTLQLHNAGTEKATNIAVNLPLDNGDAVLVGNTRTTASLGSFDGVSKTWKLKELKVGENATLQFQLFTLKAKASVFAQVTAADQTDVDSKPNNGSCCTTNEDDEAVFQAKGRGRANENNNGVVNENFTHTLYPVPAANELNYVYIAEKAGALSYKIHDLTGKVVQLGQWDQSIGLNHQMIQISDLPAGSYFLQAQGKEGLRFVKLD